MPELQEILNRFWTNLVERPSGPYAFRFVLQPIMATTWAILDGIKDARTGRSPYFWTILSDPAERANRLKEGLKATSKIIMLALALEVFYQVSVLRTFYIGEALIIAFVLAFLPYLLVRGPAARIARRVLARKSASRRADSEA